MGQRGLTFPTNNCVRVSRGGFVVLGAVDDAMAIWMTASISSLVGPEPAGCGFEVEEAAGTAGLGGPAWSLCAEADECRVEGREGRASVAAAGGGDCAGVEVGCEGGPEGEKCSCGCWCCCWCCWAELEEEGRGETCCGGEGEGNASAAEGRKSAMGGGMVGTVSTKHARARGAARTGLATGG